MHVIMLVHIFWMGFLWCSKSQTSTQQQTARHHDTTTGLHHRAASMPHFLRFYLAATIYH
jgi:hypothetical protein